MLEAERAALCRVTTPATPGHFAVAYPAVGLVAVGTLDATFVLDQDGVMAVQPEETRDLVVALNAHGRLRPGDILAVGLGRTVRGVALPALHLPGMVVALAPDDRRDLLGMAGQAHNGRGPTAERVGGPGRLDFDGVFDVSL